MFPIQFVPIQFVPIQIVPIQIVPIQFVHEPLQRMDKRSDKAKVKHKLGFCLWLSLFYFITCLIDPSFSLCLKQRAKLMYIKLPMNLFF